MSLRQRCGRQTQEHRRSTHPDCTQCGIGTGRVGRGLRRLLLRNMAVIDPTKESRTSSMGMFGDGPLTRPIWLRKEEEDAFGVVAADAEVAAAPPCML